MTTDLDQKIADLFPRITDSEAKAFAVQLLRSLADAQEAYRHLDRERPAQALSLLEQATALDWPFWRIWHWRGLALHRLGRYVEAIPFYHKSIAYNPDPRWIWSCSDLWSCYDIAKQYDDGWLFFSQLTQERSDWWLAWHYRGLAGYRRDKTLSEETIESYLLAIELHHEDQTWIWSSEDLKNYLYAHQAMKRGLEIFVDLTRIYPDYWILWHDRAWFEMQSGESQTAVASYQRAIAQNPKGGWFWSWKDLGEIYFQQNNFHQAIEAFSEAINQEPITGHGLGESESVWQAWKGKGNAFKHLQQFVNAISAYQAAIRYEQNLSELCFLLGVCQEKDGQLARAFESYCQSLRADPNYVAAREAREATLPNLRRKLLDFLEKRFDLEDLRTLCFHLSVDYDSLPGEGKRGKARELITYQVRTSGEDYIPLRDLITEMNAMRPDVPLP